MNLINLNMTKLIPANGSGSFHKLTVMIAVISFTLFLISLFASWMYYKNSLQESKRLSYINGYVNSMVCTYFYGYLKKIIPDPGTGTGLYYKIQRYKEKQNLTDQDFPFHKIFIIICASGFVPPSLEKIDNKRIEARKHLDPLVLNNAGVNGRRYTTGVYKVYNHNLTQHITVAMEGAPPLLTLSDASAEDPELKQNKKQIIHMFCKQLSKKLAEHPEFANSYEIVFYNDDPDKAPYLANHIFLRHIDVNVTKSEDLE